MIELDGFGTTTSDNLGNWSLNETGFSLCLADTLVACGLEARDEDGTENGGPYDPELVVLNLDQTAPGSGWNMGTYEQHGVQIIMEEPAVEYGPLCAQRERIREENGEN